MTADGPCRGPLSFPSIVSTAIL